MIDSSSKLSLKVSCLRACDNDINKAKELYLFLSEDLTDIPDIPIEQPSGFTQVKSNLGEMIQWVESHKDEVAQGIHMLRSLRGVIPTKVVTNIEPIPKV